MCIFKKKKKPGIIINEHKIRESSPKVRELVEWLASEYGKITVTSGARTTENNRRIGGRSMSWHLITRGAFAVDIKVDNVSCIKVVAKVLDQTQRFPIRGVGINPYPKYNYCHLDFRPGRQVTYWTYDKYNRYK